MPYNIQELLTLPAEEREDIALALWESVEEEQRKVVDDIPAFAEKRYQQNLDNPEDIISWGAARKQIKKVYGI